MTEAAMTDPFIPHHRLPATLPDGVVEIEDAGGAIKRLDGEALLVAVAGEYSGHKPMNLGEPGFESTLSGGPGYLLRTEDVELALGLGEIVHLLLNALTPEQYFKLRELYGPFDLIGETYYDPGTGQARQPKVRVPKA